MGLLLSLICAASTIGLSFAFEKAVASTMIANPTPTNSTALSGSMLSHSTPAQIPAITLPPLPPDFNDIPSESVVCYDSWASARAHNAFVRDQVSSLASSITRMNYTATSVDTRGYRDCETLPFTGKYITLCDGLARNTELRDNVTCFTVSHTYTSTWSVYETVTTSIPAWLSSWSRSNRVSLPSCTAARDHETFCYRLHSAYSWRTNQAKATPTANITGTPEHVYAAEKPTCRTLRNPPAANLTTKSCYFDVGQYEMHYWPPVPLTGSSFCANITQSPEGTRTIPWLPNTAVVSGLTLTSPSVYHFLKDVRVSTSIGGQRMGRAGLSPVYNLSSSIPQTILTLPQEESEVWTAQPTRLGRGLHAHWEWSFGNGSYSADAMATARSAAYFNACPRERRFDCHPGGSTISQAHFRQYAAVSIRDVLDEWDSDEFKDCVWHQYWEQGPWYDRQDMWVAPGQPWRATPIMTDDEDEPEATRMPIAEPASMLDAVALKTLSNRVTEATATNTL